MSQVLCLLPASDFDPTEAALPWDALVRAGHAVTFATPAGAPSRADVRLTDTGFGWLDPFLMTLPRDVEAYRRMAASPAFAAPLRHDAVDADAFDALLVPGGHAAGMRTLLESRAAQAVAARFMAAGKPVGAVCHGVVLLARATDPRTGRSVLEGRRATALPVPFELSAWAVTAPQLGRYYRTYPQTVAAEVRAALGPSGHWDGGPLLAVRDSPERPGRGFVVEDGALLTARWPGDCNRFAERFSELLTPGRAA